MPWTQQDVGPEPDQIDIDRDLVEHRRGGKPLLVGTKDQQMHLRCVERLRDVETVFGSVREADIQQTVDVVGCPHLIWRLRELFGCGPKPGGATWQADGHVENRKEPHL